MRFSKTHQNNLFAGFLSLCIFLSSCHADIEDQPESFDSIYTKETYAETMTSVTEFSSDEAEYGDTVSVSPVRYTIKHTVHDFTASLPEKLYSDDAITYDNLYVDQDGVHIYIRNHSTNTPVIYTYHPDTADDCATGMPVPLINDKTVRMAHRLTDGRYILLARDGISFYWFLTESDGTVIAKAKSYPGEIQSIGRRKR